ncbi:S8 family peptidase [Paenibacillus glucanolyticus]|jgi:major intracellular serine protease|nr:S8 family peptidase [Paenibacillus glucanolyticus]
MDFHQLVSLLNHEVLDSSDEKNNGLDMIHVHHFWNRGIFGSGVVIAVLDTGIDMSHEDLKENVIGGRNFTQDYQYDPMQFQDEHGHGTHVAGIIAARNDMIDIGVSPKAKLLILKTLANNGNGLINNVIEAIYYAILWRGPNGERVNIITMSLGTKVNNPLLHDAIRYALAHNISVVAASGNDGDGQVTQKYRYPGAYQEVIQVGAVNSTKNLARFSNSNEQLDLVAPGEHIYSTYLNNSYKSLSGTSMAAPFVAGALALIIEESKMLFNRDFSEQEVYAQLIKSTKYLFGQPAIEGNGLLNLSRFLVIG